MRPEEALLLSDTHAHLSDAAFADDLEEVLARAREVGVTRILAVGEDLASSQRALALARAYEPVYAAVGIHPHQVKRFAEEAEGVRALLTAPKVVAVGEIGLDYYRGTENREKQLAAFRAQLHWAVETGLPVSVHNRAADDDVLTLLAEVPVTAILHCFSGSPATAERAVAAGHAISFAGNLTYRKAQELRDAAACVPLAQLLIETDAPVLAPQRWRGTRNEPAYLPATLEALAALRGLPASELAMTISRNADRLLRWRSS